MCYKNVVNKSLKLHVYNEYFYLPDSIDTKSSLEAIRDMVTATNIYIDGKRKSEGGVTSANRMLLHNIALYITKLLKVSVKDL